MTQYEGSGGVIWSGRDFGLVTLGGAALSALR